jgi:hypothetical protein
VVHIQLTFLRALPTVLTIAFIAMVAGTPALPAALNWSRNSSPPFSARAMNSFFPKSISPASFAARPMPATRLLPARAMWVADGRMLSGVAPRSAGTLAWTELSGRSSQVAVAPDGSVWALSNLPSNSTDKNIWHDVNGKWTNVAGLASSIAVGPTGTVYTVNSRTAGVYAYTGRGWSYLGGGARSVTAAADGSIYILSSTEVYDNSAIWRDKNGVWTQLTGMGAQLASSFDANTYNVPGAGTIVPGGFFVINTLGVVYYWSPGIGYVELPGTASGVAAVSGGLYELNYPASASGEGLHYLDYATAAVTPQTSYGGVALAAGPGPGGTGTQLYEVTAADYVWTTPVAAVLFNDYATFGYDNQRDVFNPNSTAITPASLPNLHLAWQTALNGGADFTTQTQPVLATEISGHSGVLFVGGGTGNVYAYDATSGALLWTKNFGQVQYTCGPTTGFFGTGGTVAYDPATRSLYVIGNANASPNTYANDTLYHLDAATGTVLGSVNFTPTGAGPQELDISHTSVTLSGGTAYVGTGSFCDISSWRGRVVAINVPSMTVANAFFTLWDPQNARGHGAQPWSGGGIWGWGGVSLDSTGHVFTAVGNGDVGDSYGTIEPPFVAMPLEYDGYAEALLELSGNLATVVANNHPVPTNYYSYSSNLDQQGTPVVFTPPGCGTMLAAQGKSGELSLFDESSLSSGPVAQYQMSPSSSAGNFIGEPAYSPVTGLVYSNVVTSAAPTLFNPGMVAVNPGCGHPTVAWQAAFGSSADQLRSVPATSAGGVVFAGEGTSLWALDATTGAILNGGQPFAHTSAQLRMPVTIDGDWVYIIDNNGNFYAYTTDQRFAAIAVKKRASTARQRFRWTERHD